jgi:hypothetical protein
MPKHRPARVSLATQINLLDVRLLDLFAQLEAIMRCAREIQRAAIHLRAAAHAGTTDATSARKITKGVATLARESQALQSVVQSVSQAADDIRPGGQSSPARVSRASRKRTAA